MLSTSLLLVVAAYVPTYSPVFGHSPQPPYYLEDAIDGFVQLHNSGILLLFSLVTLLSSALFNASGFAITKTSEAKVRSLLDLSRTVIVWMFSLGIGWQKFHILQVRDFLI